MAKHHRNAVLPLQANDALEAEQGDPGGMKSGAKKASVSFATFMLSITLPLAQRLALRSHYLLPVFASDKGLSSGEVGAVMGIFYFVQVLSNVSIMVHIRYHMLLNAVSIGLYVVVVSSFGQSWSVYLIAIAGGLGKSPAAAQAALSMLPLPGPNVMRIALRKNWTSQFAGTCSERERVE